MKKYFSDMNNKIKKILAPIYYRIFPTWKNILRKECDGFSSVLDLGCGYNSPVRWVDIPNKIGVDIYDNYLNESQAKKIHDEYKKGDLLKIEFERSSFDIVLCSDVIEHLKKEDGENLLNKAEAWAKDKIIFTTPNGFLPQNIYHGNEFQEHKSGWLVDDFRRRGYRVYGYNGFKFLKGEEGRILYKPRWFWRVIADASNFIVYYFPSIAFQLFAVKDKNK